MDDDQLKTPLDKKLDEIRVVVSESENNESDANSDWKDDVKDSPSP